MSEGDEYACRLEEIRTKLLLAPVPRGSHLKVELSRRLQLWIDGKFVELLSRAENQAREAALHRSVFRSAAKHGSRARRARHLVSEGAYSKATASLQTETADLDAAAQLH